MFKITPVIKHLVFIAKCEKKLESITRYYKF